MKPDPVPLPAVRDLLAFAHGFHDACETGSKDDAYYSSEPWRYGHLYSLGFEQGSLAYLVGLGGEDSE